MCLAVTGVSRCRRHTWRADQALGECLALVAATGLRLRCMRGVVEVHQCCSRPRGQSAQISPRWLDPVCWSAVIGAQQLDVCGHVLSLAGEQQGHVCGVLSLAGEQQGHVCGELGVTVLQQCEVVGSLQQCEVSS